MSNSQNNASKSRLGSGLDGLLPTSLEDIDEFASDTMPKEARVDAKSIIEIPIIEHSSTITNSKCDINDFFLEFLTNIVSPSIE